MYIFYIALLYTWKCVAGCDTHSTPPTITITTITTTTNTTTTTTTTINNTSTTTDISTTIIATTITYFSYQFLQQSSQRSIHSSVLFLLGLRLPFLCHCFAQSQRHVLQRLLSLIPPLNDFLLISHTYWRALVSLGLRYSNLQ